MRRSRIIKLICIYLCFSGTCVCAQATQSGVNEQKSSVKNNDGVARENEGKIAVNPAKKNAVAPQVVNQKDLDAQLKKLEAALKKDPDNADLLVEAGNTALQAGNSRIGVDHLRRAIELLKTKPQGKYNVLDLQRRIIKSYMNRRNRDMAIVEYKNLCFLQPDNIALEKEFADFLIASGYPLRAYKVYKDILTKKPDDKESINKMTWLYQKKYVTIEEIEPFINK